ncbi:MAG: hypothetical protein LQ346_009049 [Caloplaca aetnensis]|nr:MAG: hypothetical protein LQ346_009049 [Caloplaca aetnensis]
MADHHEADDNNDNNITLTAMQKLDLALSKQPTFHALFDDDASKRKLSELFYLDHRILSFWQLLKGRHEALLLSTRPSVGDDDGYFYGCLMANMALVVAKAEGWAKEFALFVARRTLTMRYEPSSSGV